MYIYMLLGAALGFALGWFVYRFFGGITRDDLDFDESELDEDTLSVVADYRVKVITSVIEYIGNSFNVTDANFANVYRGTANTNVVVMRINGGLRYIFTIDWANHRYHLVGEAVLNTGKCIVVKSTGGFRVGGIIESSGLQKNISAMMRKLFKLYKKTGGDLAFEDDGLDEENNVEDNAVESDSEQSEEEK